MSLGCRKKSARLSLIAYSERRKLFVSLNAYFKGFPHRLGSFRIMSDHLVPFRVVSRHIFLLLAFSKCGQCAGMHTDDILLQTFDEVVEALGGKAELGLLCNNQNIAAVCNWKRRRPRFAAKYFVVMQGELNARGYSAPLELWGFYTRKETADQ